MAVCKFDPLNRYNIYNIYIYICLFAGDLRTAQESAVK